MPIRIRTLISYQYGMKYAIEGCESIASSKQIHVMKIKTSVFLVTSVKFAIISDKKHVFAYSKYVS